jgi:hypothetical protein
MKEIVKMTPFVYEDGNIYYFNILDTEYSNDFHNLFVYKKIFIDKSNWINKRDANLNFLLKDG